MGQELTQTVGRELSALCRGDMECGTKGGVPLVLFDPTWQAPGSPSSMLPALLIAPLNNLKVRQ